MGGTEFGPLDKILDTSQRLLSATVRCLQLILTV